jgi:hypothetical protein
MRQVSSEVRHDDVTLGFGMRQHENIDSRIIERSRQRARDRRGKKIYAIEEMSSVAVASTSQASYKTESLSLLISILNREQCLSCIH